MLPSTLAVISLVAAAGCSPPAPADASSPDDVAAVDGATHDTAASDAPATDMAMTDAPATDTSTADVSSTEPMCRVNPARPPSDPCEPVNFDAGFCAYNRLADGGIECTAVV